MRYIDFFADLAAEMTGTPKDIILQRMESFAQNVEDNPILHQEISFEHAEKLRAAALADPDGFSRWVDEGFKKAFSNFGLKMA